MTDKNLILKAFASSKQWWSFCVKEEKTGLFLPIIYDDFSISIDKHSHGILALNCRIDLNLIDEKFLPIAIKDNELVSGNLKLATLEPFTVYHSPGSNRCTADCVVALSGFDKADDI